MLPLLAFGGWTALAGSSIALTAYDFGNPTALEQQYIELINRSRANPPAEGARLAATTDANVLYVYNYYGVNLTVMQSEFNAIPAQPPLAPNACLMVAARGHSDWMLANATQSHNESATNTPYTRMTAAGYSWATGTENLYAYSQSVWFGHVGINVDWGTDELGHSTYGMQGPPRGHRTSLHCGSYHEIGVGVTLGTNGVSPYTVGPQLVTQDLATSTHNPTLATGVAYYDLNANNFYDPGEGIAGLTVNVSGADVTDFCTTAIGGGWVVPVPATAATRTVRFSGLNMNQTASLVVPTSTNAKADLKLTYTAPTFTSPTTAYAGIPHAVAFTAIGGATSYKWSRWPTTYNAPPENCESTGNVTTTTAGGYAMLNTAFPEHIQEGSASFHLVSTVNYWNDESIQLNALYYGQTSPALTFQSKMRLAVPDTIINGQSYPGNQLKVQVKEEGSSVWEDVYSQTGAGASGPLGYGEEVFTLRSAALTAMAGKKFRVRFLMASNGWDYWQNGYSDYFGWFIDAIHFTGVSTVDSGSTTQTVSTNSGTFTPSADSYLISVTPVISGLDFPSSTYQTLVVNSTPPNFAAWAAAYETANDLTPGTIANNPSADWDHDGRINLLEYAFGGSPVTHDAAPGTPAIVSDPTYYIMQYERDLAHTDLTYTPQACSDLSTWKAPGASGALVGFADTLISAIGTVETRQARVPNTSATKVFLRMRVTQP